MNPHNGDHRYDAKVREIRAAGLAKDIPDFVLYPMFRAYSRMGCALSQLQAAKPVDALAMVKAAWKRFAEQGYVTEVA